MTEQATKRLTMAQAVIAFLKNQYVERDGREQPFFAGCFGIFGHGNVAGIGQALQQMPEFRYYQARNEQAMVHSTAAYAKTKNRLQTLACTSCFSRYGQEWPEFDRFGLFTHEEALSRVGKSLAALLAGILPLAQRDASK